MTNLYQTNRLDSEIQGCYMLDSRIIVIEGVGPVLLEKSRRAKRVSISIRPFRGIRVAVPFRVPYGKAEEFVHTKINWLEKQLRKMKQYEKESIAVSITSFSLDKAEARRKLTGRLDYLAEKHGFSYNRVFIRNQRTRWGSCSHNNNISLNMKLLHLPEELMDYVILHELVHTRIMNHSRAFWAELDNYVPNSKKKASRLKEYRLGAF
ncbi:M48 family metallopeptidase [Chloroflexota bacterium]